MGMCSECINWRNDQWITNKYGEGCGICRPSGEVTFCSHPCPLCITIEDEEALNHD